MLNTPVECHWQEIWTKEVEYLGMIISENQLRMDPVKRQGIAEWPAPTKVKNVRSFLGFGNYYRWFIHDYGNITRLLNDLLDKNKTFEWSQEWQETFELLKRKFQESPVLLTETVCSRKRCIEIRIRSSTQTTRQQW